jgi:hypothetical protein
MSWKRIVGELFGWKPVALAIGGLGLTTLLAIIACWVGYLPPDRLAGLAYQVHDNGQTMMQGGGAWLAGIGGRYIVPMLIAWFNAAQQKNQLIRELLAERAANLVPKA